MAQMKVKKPLVHSSIGHAVACLKMGTLDWVVCYSIFFPVKRHISYDVFVFILYALMCRSYLVYNPLT